MPPRLKEKYRRKNPGASSILIVYVANPSPSKDDDYTCDIDQLTAASSDFARLDCKIFLYQYVARIDSHFRWHHLLNACYELLEALNVLCAEYKDKPCPLVLIGEGLGGIVIKQTLWKAREQLFRYRTLLDIVSGIIFLATPHTGQNDDDTATRLGIILRQYTKSTSHKAATKEYIKPYQICALHFEELKVNVPVLSAYETTEIRLRNGLLSSRKTALLVDEDFAATKASRETLMGLDLPVHQMLDHMVESKTRNQILGFILDLREEAQRRIVASLQEGSSYNVRIPSMRTPTPAASVTHPTPPSPNQRHISSSSEDVVLLTPPTKTSSGPVSSGPNSHATGSGTELVNSLRSLGLEERHIKLPCHFTKPHARNRDFFARPDVTESIERALLNSGDDQAEETFEQSLKTFVLCGMGGMGKTEIAMHFVFSHLKDFDAVFIFHADQASTLAEEFHKAAFQLGLQQSLKMDPQDSRELLKNWFADPQKALARTYPLTPTMVVQPERAKWLILFDNADDPSILAEYWPTDGTGSILVTSRNPMAKSSFFFGDEGFEIQPLEASNAADWIIKLTKTHASASETLKAAATIAKRLDGLPLAITQITSIIRMRQLDLAEFVELYEDALEDQEFQSMRIGNRRGYEHSLASVWALNTLEPGPLTLLSVISMLDPDAIQEEILKTAMAQFHRLNYPANPREYHNVLTPLLQSSIVQRNSTVAELRIHRLVTDVVRAKIQSMNRFVEIFNLSVDLVCSVWPFWRMGAKAGATHNVDRWGQSGKMYPHVYRLFQKFPLARQIVGSLKPFGKFADLLIEAAWYQFERSNFSEPGPLLDMAEKICEELQPDTYEQLSIISAARFAMQQWKNDGEAALPHAERYLEFQKLERDRKGKNTTEYSYGLYAMGVALGMCKVYSKAIPYLEQAMDIRKGLPGFKPVDAFSPMYHQSLAALNQGRHEDCENLLRQMLDAREQAGMAKDMSSYRPGNVYFTLGQVYARRGMLDESYTWHMRSLQHFIPTIGEGHIFTAHACCRVAEHHIRCNEDNEARNLLDQTIRIYKEKPYFKDELAWSYYLYARLLAKSAGSSSTALTMLENAATLLNEIRPHMQLVGPELKEEHFDGLGIMGFS